MPSALMRESNSANRTSVVHMRLLRPYGWTRVYTPLMELVDELDQRGLVAEVTDRDELAQLLAVPVAVYAGYDPSSPSLHVGNLVPTILLKRFQLAGHKPIVVVGGATGMIGDPSGKSAERNLLDDDTIAANLAGIRSQLSRLLDFDDPHNGAVMTNNADWTRGVSYLEFLRDIGKHLTVNYMMAKDSVQSRLSGDAGISYTEFSYMLLQAFDFVALSRSHDCRVQVGGNDQYGNITAGCELSRKLGGPRLFGLTAPLLLDAAGQKMGKTSTGERIWLDPQRTSAYAFYQYWLNRPDEEAPRLLRMFSLRPLAEIAELVARHDTDRASRLVQSELARSLTAWVHGDDAIKRVEAASRVMFGNSSLTGLKDADLAELAAIVPTVDIPRNELELGIGIIELLARIGISDSKGDARRLVAQHGAYLNNESIAEIDRRVTTRDLLTETMMVLRSGKKTHRLVRVV
jgi:tyrosyl-tRNA synthetase